VIYQGILDSGVHARFEAADPTGLKMLENLGHLGGFEFLVEVLLKYCLDLLTGHAAVEDS
jgi:hypothetical protein